MCRFGVPRSIHSDQGRNFESTLFTELCNLLQMHKMRTTAYMPQSNGMVERFNRTLLSMLSLFVDSNQQNWDTLLPHVMMAYRCSTHATTKFFVVKRFFLDERLFCLLMSCWEWVRRNVLSQLTTMWQK